VSVQANSAQYFIWGIDQSAYGPVELPTLVNWVKDERVLADTWVFVEQEVAWRRAADIAELQMFFRSQPVALAVNTSASVKPGVLRRVKVLAGFSNAQLEHFAQFTELQRLSQWTVVVRQGEQGDTMYLILEGELRVRLLVDGKETILTTLGPGDFFGDMALFDHGPRSADVVANVDSTVLKISSANFAALTEQAPDLAAPFLLAASKTLAARIRADNKRMSKSVRVSSAVGQ